MSARVKKTNSTQDQRNLFDLFAHEDCCVKVLFLLNIPLKKLFAFFFPVTVKHVYQKQANDRPVYFVYKSIISPNNGSEHYGHV